MGPYGGHRPQYYLSGYVLSHCEAKRSASSQCERGDSVMATAGPYGTEGATARLDSGVEQATGSGIP
jgi:hypothetical protein